MRYYILDSKNHIVENDLSKWAKWFESADRTVKITKINDKEVSTVFLGIDHGFDGGPPLLFETMVFPECDECERYSTWEEAEKGHDKMVQKMMME